MSIGNTTMTCDRLVCGSTRDVLAVVAALIVAIVISAALIWLIESADGRSLSRRPCGRDEEKGEAQADG